MISAFEVIKTRTYFLRTNTVIVLKAVTEFERSCLIQCNDSTLMVLALAFISDVLQYRSLIQRHMHCKRLTEIRCIPACTHTYGPHTLVSQ